MFGMDVKQLKHLKGKDFKQLYHSFLKLLVASQDEMLISCGLRVRIINTLFYFQSKNYEYVNLQVHVGLFLDYKFSCVIGPILQFMDRMNYYFSLASLASLKPYREDGGWQKSRVQYLQHERHSCEPVSGSCVKRCSSTTLYKLYCSSYRNFPTFL